MIRSITNRFYLAFILVLILANCKQKEGDGWIDLYNGKDLTGWTANENPESFRVENGFLVANGQRSHLFYTGDVSGGSFRNFELSVDLMTFPRANSGIYILTTMQKEGFPKNGFEIQVNNSHIGGGDYREYKKGGSLYGIRNTYKEFVAESVWYNTHIVVRGNHVTVEIDGRKVVDHVQPADTTFSHQGAFSRGTFALQGHDPGSKVLYKSIRVKLLPDTEPDVPGVIIFNDTQKKMMDLQHHQMSFTDLDVSPDSTFQIGEAMDFYYKTGINLGLVFDAKNAVRHAEYSNYPVFLGLRSDAVKNIDPRNFDYVIGSVPFNTEEKITNPEGFMKTYMAKNLDLLNSKTIDIWSSPTLLPASIASQYDKLWTKDRMLKVIGAAHQNGVAIEINNALRIPGHDFIKLAKKNGCLFTYGGIGRKDEMGTLDYIFQVIERDSLGYKDIYLPGAPWLDKSKMALR